MTLSAKEKRWRMEARIRGLKELAMGFLLLMFFTVPAGLAALGASAFDKFAKEERAATIADYRNTPTEHRLERVFTRHDQYGDVHYTLMAREGAQTVPYEAKGVVQVISDVPLGSPLWFTESFVPNRGMGLTEWSTTIHVHNVADITGDGR
ncbi:MAG: hypothetical protein AAB590_01670 [Patescibacteria group bacterium]